MTTDEFYTLVQIIITILSAAALLLVFVYLAYEKS